MNEGRSRECRARPVLRRAPHRSLTIGAGLRSVARAGLTLLVCGAVRVGVAAERSIDKEVVIDASLDQAWSTWTSREGITSFFAPDARVEPRVGGPFQIYMDPAGDPGMKGADDMRYMALQPRRMLSFDWNAPPSLPEARQQRTFVVVRFFAVDEQHTRVTLHHTGWGDGGEWDRAYTYFDRAWGTVLGHLKQRFETGPIDWSPWLRRLDEGRGKAPAQP